MWKNRKVHLIRKCEKSIKINFILTRYIQEKVFYIWIMSVLIAITFRASLADILCTPISAKISADVFLSLLFSASSSNIAEPTKIFKSIHASLILEHQNN